MIQLLVHQPAYPSFWPAVPSLQRGLSTNPGVTMWGICDLEEGDLFVLSWATSEAGKYVFRASNVWCAQDFVIASYGFMARCLDTIGVCIWHMFVFMSVVVIV